MQLPMFPNQAPRQFGQADADATGTAGEMLVWVHMAMMGIECGIIHGRHVDIVALVDGRFLRIQVKSSMVDRTFGGANTVVANNRNSITARGLLSYSGHVDAFAFCYFPDPYPYYVAVPAIGKNQETFSPSCFTRHGRDRSFEELLRRWRNGL